MLAILAKSIAIAIAILGGNSIAILSAILYFKSVLQYTIAILFSILHLELVHTFNMALAVIVNCIIISGSHDALTLSFLHLHNTKQNSQC